MLKVAFLSLIFVLSVAPVFAQELEAGKGELAIANICEGTIGETVQKTSYENSSLDVKAYCQDGQFSGVVKKYSPAGKIRMKAEYTAGQLNGTVKLHDEGGNILFQDEYENGDRKSRLRFDANGAPVPVP